MIRQPPAPHAPTLTPRRFPPTTVGPAASETVSPARYRGAGLALILVAAFMVVLDSTARQSTRQREHARPKRRGL